MEWNSFDFNMFDGASSDYDMGGQGVLAPSAGFDIPYVEEVPWYHSPSILPAGATDVMERSDTMFWGFDQSKITNGLGDVLSSVIQAGAKTAIQKAAGSMNTAANGQGQLANFFQNFRSTKTGAEINAGATAFSVQNFVMNPMVWFAAVGLVVLIFVMRR